MGHAVEGLGLKTIGQLSFEQIVCPLHGAKGIDGASELIRSGIFGTKLLSELGQGHDSVR